MYLFSCAKSGFSRKGLFIVLHTLFAAAERLLALPIPVATHKIQ
jgi:hypothetical protein